MNELIAVATITIFAVISPGGDFAMVTRNSLLSGRRAGLWTALGIALGNWVHIAYTLIGVAVLVKTAPIFLIWLKWLGAAYLIYIGVQTMRSKSSTQTGKGPSMSDTAALKLGFLTNALNPKTTLFVVSLYSQVVDAHTSFGLQLAYGAFISLTHGVWFALVAWVFSDARLVDYALSKQVWVNRIIGLILFLLGVMLGLSSLSY